MSPITPEEVAGWFRDALPGKPIPPAELLAEIASYLNDPSTILPVYLPLSIEFRDAPAAVPARYLPKKPRELVTWHARAIALADLVAKALRACSKKRIGFKRTSAEVDIIKHALDAIGIPKSHSAIEIALRRKRATSKDSHLSS